MVERARLELDPATYATVLQGLQALQMNVANAIATVQGQVAAQLAAAQAPPAAAPEGESNGWDVSRGP
jgi:hypothetical protein